jgi:hypothetical protein
MQKAKEVYGWHFLPADGFIAHGEFAGEKKKRVEVGMVYSVSTPLVICEWGLHASVKALDALGYAPGPIATYVRLSGEMIVGGDKMCAENREVIGMVDATDVLREFIRDSLVVRQPHIVSLFGKIGLVDHADAIRALDMDHAEFGEIEKVVAAARAATRAAAWAAAWDAARAAARDAAWDAARDAARAAAWDAARDAARAAAWYAARAAAWAAAWDAARDAAWADLNARLEARLFAAIRITR